MKQWIASMVTAFCLWGLAVGNASAQVTEAFITADGTGLSREDAIQSALVSAAGQAFGIDLSASTQSVHTAVDAHVDNESLSVMVSELNKNVQQVLRTPANAPILGYNIDRVQALPDAGWEATVTLRYAKFERMGADSNRRGVVVAGNHKQYGKMLRQTVAEAIVASRRFDVLNRENDELFEDEKAFITGGDAAIAEMARLSQARGADYIVNAEFVNLGISNNQRETIRMTGEVLVRSSVSGALRLQVVEFASRKVKWSGTQKFGGTYEGVSHVGTGTLSRLVSGAANKLVVDMVAAIYPIRVVKSMGTMAVINRGEGSVKAGETFAVFLEGEELIDPQSGESLGSMEIEVGRGTITEVKPKFAFLKMASGTLEADANYILRKTGKKPASAAPAKRAASAQPPKRAAQQPSRADTFLSN